VVDGGHSCSRDPHRNWSFRLAKPSFRSWRRTSNTDPVRNPNRLLRMQTRKNLERVEPERAIPKMGMRWVARVIALMMLPPFPLHEQVSRLQPLMSESQISTHFSRAEYLSVINGIVSYFRNFQALDGRIIDPFVRREVQYEHTLLCVGGDSFGRKRSASRFT